MTKFIFKGGKEMIGMIVKVAIFASVGGVLGAGAISCFMKVIESIKSLF